MAVRNKLRKLIICFCFCITMAFALFVAFDLCMRPLAKLLCEFKAEELAAEAVNLSSIELAHMVFTEDIIFIERDGYGRITAITTDSNRMATYASTLAQDIQTRINSTGQAEVNIYFSEVLGGQLSSGRGPVLKMRFAPVSVVKTDIRNEFESAGINQTRHSMIADIEVKVRVSLPLQTIVVNFQTSSLLAETIIIGEIPDTYLKSNEGDGVKYDLLPR